MSWYSDGENVTKWDLYHSGDWDGDDDDEEYITDLSGDKVPYEWFSDFLRKDEDAYNLQGDFEADVDIYNADSQEYFDLFAEYYYEHTGREIVL